MQGVGEFLGLHSHPAPVLRVIEPLCFFGSEAYFKRLTVLWNGRIVYPRRWEGFLEEMRTEWGRKAAFVSLLAAHTLAKLLIYDEYRRRASGRKSPCILLYWVFTDDSYSANMIRPDASESGIATLATAAFSGAAVVASLALLQRHTKAILSGSPGIVSYIALP